MTRLNTFTMKWLMVSKNRQVKERLESVEEAKYQVKQMSKEIQLDIQEITAAKLNPTGVQDAGFNNEVDLGMDTKNETLFLP